MNPLPSRVLIFVALAIGFLLAWFLGVAIGGGELLPLVVVAGFGFFAWYIVVLQRFTVLFAFLVLFAAFNYTPLGFRIDAVHVACALGFALALLHCWHNAPASQPELLRRPSFAFLKTAITIWLIYVAIHLLANYLMPYRPRDFALRNFIKSYFLMFGPLLMMLYFFSRPHGFAIPENFLRRVTQLLLLGLLINIAIRLYGFYAGSPISVSGLDEDTAQPLFYIPVIGLTENLYILRSLGGVGVLICTVILTSPGRREQRSGDRLLASFTIPVALFGAVISGGRVSIILAIGMGCVVLWLRKRLALLIALFALASLAVAGANFFSNEINRKAPLAVARSLQYILINKSAEASQSIESSTNWRYELFQRAIAEWKSEPRIFWFGRATYEYSEADFLADRLYGGYEAGFTSSLRRGATHNLATDLLIQVGLVGFVLYMVVLFALVAFTYSMYRERRLPPPLRDLSTICFVGTIVPIVPSLIGGGYYSNPMVWSLMVLVVSIYRFQPAPAPTVPEPAQPSPSSPLPAMAPLRGA